MERQQELEQWLKAQLADRPNTVQALPGDASFRRYHRVYADQKSYILVDARPEYENSETYLKVAKLFANSGICVPDVFAADAKRGFLLLKDFGDELLLDALAADPIARYQQSLRLLSQIQAIPLTACDLPVYDAQFMDKELSLFNEWYLSKHLGLTLNAAEHAMLEEMFAQIKSSLAAQEQVCIHRDFQSRNIMVLADGSLGLIDFQDAMIGPVSYDFVSLIKDCYIDWPPSVVMPIMTTFCQQQHYAIEEFKPWFHMAVIQRHLKNLGIFARLAYRDQRPQYLQYNPRLINYLTESFNALPEFSPLMNFFQTQIIPKQIGVM